MADYCRFGLDGDIMEGPQLPLSKPTHISYSCIEKARLKYSNGMGFVYLCKMEFKTAAHYFGIVTDLSKNGTLLKESRYLGTDSKRERGQCLSQIRWCKIEQVCREVFENQMRRPLLTASISFRI